MIMKCQLMCWNYQHGQHQWGQDAHSSVLTKGFVHRYGSCGFQWLPVQIQELLSHSTDMNRAMIRLSFGMRSGSLFFCSSNFLLLSLLFVFFGCFMSTRVIARARNLHCPYQFLAFQHGLLMRSIICFLVFYNLLALSDQLLQICSSFLFYNLSFPGFTSTCSFQTILLIHDYNCQFCNVEKDQKLYGARHL